MGYGAIKQALNDSRGAQGPAGRTCCELQNAVRVLEQDFVQLAPRPVRRRWRRACAAGAGRAASPATQAALSAGAPSGPLPIVALTRAGWTNPTGLQRPGLQRVAYFLENGTLRREFWTVLDPTLASTTTRRDLLTHVKSVTFRYLDVNHQWQDQWPPATNTVLIGHDAGAGAAAAADRRRDHSRHRGLGQGGAHRGGRRMKLRNRPSVRTPATAHLARCAARRRADRRDPARRARHHHRGRRRL